MLIHRFVPLVILCLLTLPSCAPRLTLSQEITWDAYKACIAEGSSTQLEQVYPDGRWFVRGNEGEVFKVSNCMQRYWRDTAPLAARPGAGGAAAAVAAPMAFAT